jgi:2-polyprenyl-3-methyl-5-hydroxy-6-metoxy-1,4-benzoquinol methylase
MDHDRPWTLPMSDAVGALIVVRRQARRVWNQIFGAAMTERLKRFLLPDLRWSQEIYAETIACYMTPETRWLDAGCGHQLLAEGLEAVEDRLISSVHLVVGVDVQFNGPGRRELPLRACADLKQLPFPDGEFQLVSCNMVVEHLQEPAVALREMTRVLSPGGHLVIHTPNVHSYVISVGRFAKAILPRAWIFRLIRWSESREPTDVFPTYYQANSMGKLRTLLREAGSCEQSAYFLAVPQPIFRPFAPLALLELLLQRVSLLYPFRFLRGVLLVVGQKPAPRETDHCPLLLKDTVSRNAAGRTEN